MTDAMSHAFLTLTDRDLHCLAWWLAWVQATAHGTKHALWTSTHRDPSSLISLKSGER